jgi:hypothetical protein
MELITSFGINFRAEDLLEIIAHGDDQRRDYFIAPFSRPATDINTDDAESLPSIWMNVDSRGRSTDN